MSDRCRVLVVDDDPDIRDVVTAILEVDGFEVETRSDGIDVLDPPGHFDAILIDVRMPVFDGERLIDYWALTKPDLLRRVIVMTGYSNRSASWEPAFAVVLKPFAFEEIVKVVRQCVGRP